jgi:putative oxidoreductase
MRRWLYCDENTVTSVGLLILRLVMGAAFILHGWPKIQNPTAWLGAGNPTPALFQALAAVAEFGGGIALILGLLTRVAAVGLAVTMVVAITTFHLPQRDPFVNPGGSSWELAGIYLACSILLFLTGPGRISLDAAFFGPRTERVVQPVGAPAI